MTEYLVPAGFGQGEYTEKRSRFIGQLWPVESEAEALAHLAAFDEALNPVFSLIGETIYTRK